MNRSIFTLLPCLIDCKIISTTVVVFPVPGGPCTMAMSFLDKANSTAFCWPKLSDALKKGNDELLWTWMINRLSLYCTILMYSSYLTRQLHKVGAKPRVCFCWRCISKQNWNQTMRYDGGLHIFKASVDTKLLWWQTYTTIDSIDSTFLSSDKWHHYITWRVEEIRHKHSGPICQGVHQMLLIVTLLSLPSQYQIASSLQHSCH